MIMENRLQVGNNCIMGVTQIAHQRDKIQLCLTAKTFPSFFFPNEMRNGEAK